MKTALLFLTLLLSVPAFAALGAAGSAADAAVLDYVQVRAQQDGQPYSVEVTIKASIPSMGKVGTLRAVRNQAGEGKLNYQAMVFEGDSMVKTNVIARYLTAELESQRPEQKLATEISPVNYEFKQKGREKVNDRDALVFEVKPRKKRQGLFRGLIWIDEVSRRPIKEIGKLAKLPSVWLKEVAFTREYTDINGVAVPAKITSKVKTRIVGEAQIEIAFQNYRFNSSDAPDAVSSLPATSELE